MQEDIEMANPPKEIARNHLSGPKGSTFYFLLLGSGIPVVFFLTTMVCGWILGDYNHLTRMVSELGALGTPSRYLFSAGLIACSALSLLFVIGLFRTCRAIEISTLPALLILSYTISIGGAGIFPLPLRLHLILGMPSVLLVLSPLLSLLLWTKVRRLPHLLLMSLVSLFVMSLGFLAFMPSILSDHLGLKQRLFHVGWSIWFVYLSYGFTQINARNRRL
jgi:hypothetical membrane protein